MTVSGARSDWRARAPAARPRQPAGGRLPSSTRLKLPECSASRARLALRLPGGSQVKAGARARAVVDCPSPAHAPPAPTGRSTYYGTDAWTLDKGSCGYGYLDKNVGTGWDTAALSDKAHDYSGHTGSQCG